MAFQTLNRFDEWLANAAAGLAAADVSAATFKCALLVGGTLNPDTGEFWSDFSANEAAGSGYTAGGQALTTVTVTRDDTNDRAFIDFDDPTWDPVTLTNVDGYVLYHDTGTPATSRVVGFDTFTATSVTNDRFRLLIPAGGILLVG